MKKKNREFFQWISMNQFLPWKIETFITANFAQITKEKG